MNKDGVKLRSKKAEKAVMKWQSLFRVAGAIQLA